MLGILPVRWIPNQKAWADHRGHIIHSRAAEIVRCPYRVAIVSTGLVMRSEAVERRMLLDCPARNQDVSCVLVYLATPKSMSWRNTLPPFSLA
jgi:hypothetical protein